MAQAVKIIPNLLRATEATSMLYDSEQARNKLSER
jgi:hypothetical protein